MNVRRSAPLAIAGLLVAALAAGCGVAAAPTPPATATATAASTSARVDITGSMTCSGSPADVTCERTMSDPRASGTETFTISTKSMPGGSISEWAQSTLKSASGTWECKSGGTQLPNEVLTIDQVCTGRDAFASLRMFVHFVSGDAGGYFSATGSIEPA